MGLKLAIKYHIQNNLELAALNYKRALKSGDHSPVLFQNYGALLKSQGHFSKSRAVYDLGLELYPDSLEILTNRANLELLENPSTALKQYLIIFARRISLDCDKASLQSSLLDLIHCMTQLGLVLLAYRYLIKYVHLTQYDSKLTLCLLQLLYHPDMHKYVQLSSSKINILFSQLESQISTYEPVDQIELRFAFAASLTQNLDHFEAKKQYELGESLANSCGNKLSSEQFTAMKKSFSIHSWNFSNALIKHQQFTEGWALYDYGLVTPTPNLPQRWQRAMAKPFSAKELPIWRGQSLQNKSILLLEEQGIGDAMQFISLIPRLFENSQFIGLFVSRRLYDIYAFSFSSDIKSKRMAIYNINHCSSGQLKSSDFNYQLPLGSLCQYLFTSPADFHPRVPILKTNEKESGLLRAKYLNRFPGATRVVGISWRGGGNSSRIKMKSIDHILFLDILKDNPNTVFVSLQYGETGSTIDTWMSFGLNINLVFDDSFNAVKDIHSWLVQVNACDAVVSVANTTIHASGGLNIPTYCLLSKHADWRWLSDPAIQRSYWYPSVGIARQNSLTNSWNEAVTKTSLWLAEGSPMPQGIDHV